MDHELFFVFVGAMGIIETIDLISSIQVQAPHDVVGSQRYRNLSLLKKSRSSRFFGFASSSSSSSL